MNNEESHNKSMEEGVSGILSFRRDGIWHNSVPMVNITNCEHESDGFIYGETDVYVVLRCSKCGEHYDKNKI